MPMLTDHIQTRWARVASFLLSALLVMLASAATAQAQDILKSNHYLCYRIAEVSGSQAAPKLSLQDQFGKSTTTLSKPSFVCNPVDKNGEGIANKEMHLVCYTVKTFLKTKVVVTKNQFGENKIKLKDSAEMLCVPSTKKVL
jgi:hypothetical protein